MSYTGQPPCLHRLLRFRANAEGYRWYCVDCGARLKRAEGQRLRACPFCDGEPFAHKCLPMELARIFPALRGVGEEETP